MADSATDETTGIERAGRRRIFHGAYQRVEVRSVAMQRTSRQDSRAPAGRVYAATFRDRARVAGSIKSCGRTLYKDRFRKWGSIIMAESSQKAQCNTTVPISSTGSGQFGSQFRNADLNDEGSWQCPHEPAAGSTRCIFHKPIESKTADETIQKFQETLEKARESSDTETKRRLKQFVGADFPALALPGSVLDTEDNFPIVLDRATIHGLFDLSDATITVPLLAGDLTVKGATNFEAGKFSAKTDFGNAEYRGTFNADSCRFKRPSSFREATFSDKVSVERATFEDNVDFTDASFHGRVGSHMLGLDVGGFVRTKFRGVAWFAGASFHNGVNFEGAEGTQAALFSRVDVNGNLSFVESSWERFIAGGITVKGGMSFRNAEFDERAEFAAAKITGISTFRDATFRGLTSFRGAELAEVVFDNATIQGRALFGAVSCDGDVYCRDMRFDGLADWSDAAIGNAYFNGTEFNRATFDGAHFHSGGKFNDCTFQEEAEFDVQTGADLLFRGSKFLSKLLMSPRASNMADQVLIDHSTSEIRGGTIIIPEDGVFIDITQSRLGQVIFESAGGNPLLRIKIKETVFDGFDFRRSTHRRWLRDLNWRPHRLDPRCEKAGLTETSDSKALEATYNNLKKGADDIADNPAASRFFFIEKNHAAGVHIDELKNGELPSQLHSLWQLASNVTFRVIAGYGERPLRVISFSIGVIIAYAIIFSYRLPSPTPYSGPLGYILLSFESFITLVLPGAPLVQNEVTVLLAQTEGFFGAFAVALFVFSLTRALKR